jgi:hypothetical protein
MEWLIQYRKDINTAIDEFFAEHYRRENITDEEKQLRDAILYALSSDEPPRIHPILAMVVYEEVLGLTADTALPVFIGLEFVHMGLKLHSETLGLEDKHIPEMNTPFVQKYGDPMAILA